MIQFRNKSCISLISRSSSYLFTLYMFLKNKRYINVRRNRNYSRNPFRFLNFSNIFQTPNTMHSFSITPNFCMMLNRSFSHDWHILISYGKCWPRLINLLVVKISNLHSSHSIVKISFCSLQRHEYLRKLT